MAEGTPGGRRTVEALALGALAALSRGPYLVALPQDPDGARFALGVQRFDLMQGHPHPPGYPVYLALGKALWWATGGAPARALSGLSALAYGALVAMVYVRARARHGRAAALLAAWVSALLPTVAVHGTRPLSDLPGAALAWAVVLAPRGLWAFGLTGLLLGLRPSVLPLVLPALWSHWRGAPKDRGRSAAALGMSVGVWLVPTLAVTGPRVWAVLLAVHARGHFGAHGVTLAGEAVLGSRVTALGWGLWTHLAGGPWPGSSPWLWVWGLACVGVLLWDRGRGLRASPEALGAGLYLGWVALGQNLEWQPRHLLPLAPWVVWGVAGAASRAGPGALAAVFAASLPRAWASHVLARTQAREAPPAVALARCAAGMLREEDALLAARQTAWWLRHELAPTPVLEVQDAQQARAHAARLGRRVYVVSEVPGAWEGEVVATCHVVGDRYVWSALYDLCLLRAPTATGSGP